MPERGGLINHAQGGQAGGLSCLQTPKKKRATIPACSYLQFGGSGANFLTDLHVLSNGNLLAVVRTNSTTFADIDISSYTDGTSYAYGVLEIDVTLPATGFIKKSYWIKCDGGQRICAGSTSAYGQVAVDSSDNVYFLWGVPADPTSTMYLKRLRASDLTLTHTSATTVATYYDYAGIITDGTYVYVGRFNAVSYLGYICKFNCADVTFVQQSTGYNHWPMSLAQIGSYLYSWDLLCGFLLKWAKVSTMPVYGSVDLNAIFNQVAGGDGLCASSTDLYISGLKKTDGNDIVVAARQSIDALTAKVGYTNFGKVIAAGNSSNFRGINYDADGKLTLCGFTTDSAVGVADIHLIEINPATGAQIADNVLKYSNGDVVAVAGKLTRSYSPACRLAPNRYAIGGWGDMELKGQTAKGSYDCFVVIADLTANILTV